MFGHTSLTKALYETTAIAQASKGSGLSDGHLRHLCRTGKLESMKFGRTWAINPDSLEASRQSDGEVGS